MSQPNAEDRSLVVVAVGGAADVACRFPDVPLDSTTVVAIDGGLDRVVAAGWVADYVVGDLDSASPAALQDAHQATVLRHPADKDATDLELGLDVVVERDLGEAVLVVGPGGGRLDHLLADIWAISGPQLADRAVVAHLGPATLTVVRPGRAVAIAASIGEQLSLLPAHGPARGVTTTGVRWPLVDADLRAGTTRAMSNEALDAQVSVQVDDGVVVVVQPGTRAPAVSPRSSPYDPTPRGVFDDR